MAENDKKEIEDILAEPQKEDDLDIDEAVEEPNSAEAPLGKPDSNEAATDKPAEEEPAEEEAKPASTDSTSSQQAEVDSGEETVSENQTEPEPKLEEPAKSEKETPREKKKWFKKKEKSKHNSGDAQSRTFGKSAREKVKEISEKPASQMPADQIVKEKVKRSPLKTALIVILTILITAAAVSGGAYFYYKKYMKKTEEPKKEEPVVTPKEETKSVVYVTARDGLKLRKEPSTSSEQLAIIPYGTALEVLETQGDWYKVNYNGQEGWVFIQYTSKEKPADADWKTYTGHGVVPGPNFSIRYPADWTLSGASATKTDAGKKYEMVFGQGGIGLIEGQNGITSSSENTSYNGLPAKKLTVKKNGEIILISAQFTKGKDTTKTDLNLPAGYNPTYLDLFEKVLATFAYS